MRIGISFYSTREIVECNRHISTSIVIYNTPEETIREEVTATFSYSIINVSYKYKL